MYGAVLVVEDEPLIRMDAVDLLEEAGLTVIEFENGSDAADYLKDHRPEIAAIFTDINLRGEVDGLELSNIADRIEPGIKVIVTSGRFIDRPEGLPRNAVFMRKPWLPLNLLTTVQDAVADREGASDGASARAEPAPDI